MSNFKAGIIGLGFIGGADQVSGDALGQQVADLDGTHFVALASHAQVNLVCGSSRDAGRRERFEERSGGATTYSDWREMLAAGNLDIVSVATYAPQHPEMVIEAARLGAKAILCEKPIAQTVPDGERMLAACEAAGTLLVINHNRRSNAQYRRLREFIAEGGLGELTSASLQWSSGRLGNVGTHMIDAIQMVTSQQVVAVSGTLDLTGRPDCRGPAFKDPGGWGMLRLESGLIVTVDAADEARVPAQITVNGSLGRAFTGGSDVTVELFGKQETATWSNPADARSSMDVAVEEIVRTLASDAIFPWSPAESVRTLEAIAGFHASHARDAAWVPLPLTGEDRDIEVQSG
jgi:predicted dehydrogenase